MRVQDLMRSRPRTCGERDTLLEAGRTMALIGAGVLPVVDDEHRVVGMLTDRDVCCALAERDAAPSAVAVRDVMSHPVHGCRATDDVRDALLTMRHHKVRRLPVTAIDGRLEGVLSLDDVALEAEIFETGVFEGPYYADVVKTLKDVVCHTMPVAVGPVT